ADSLRQINDGWQVLNKNSTLAEAEVVVLANGIDAASFAQTASLPLIPVRGQVSQIDSNERSKHLEAVVVSDRYICPAVDDSHCIGASYGANETDCEPRLVDDQENLERIRSVFQNPDLLNEEVVKSRAAVRCNTADYIPVVGAMPDEHCFKKEFAGLARNARSPQTQAGTYLPGLFINTGHGSYGLTSCPLSAEFLASLINNENLPLPVNIMESLSPCRFIIRNLKKQKPDGLRKSAIVES
ncbi:MAG: FAD-dependent 5-carboxymethylaminomethyl-2-thiouridine(34) oxidoreductase MnmC, partial [Gammaproteobacteria bacterium]|nr:FAD-dependent 5-carboxymethylaminomethyl-2-thiouridine(34) oxidoreductase MnmC [Gammaproteobacteria bacterium]